MSPNLKANCYGFATGCRKFYFPSIWCCNPKKFGKHWTLSAIPLDLCNRVEMISSKMSKGRNTSKKVGNHCSKWFRLFTAHLKNKYFLKDGCEMSNNTGLATFQRDWRNCTSGTSTVWTGVAPSSIFVARGASLLSLLLSVFATNFTKKAQDVC